MILCPPLEAADVQGIDLHIHSVHSDGELTPEAIVAKGRALGLAALSLTDHDCTDGVPCTVDYCEETRDVCTNIPASRECQNGIFCDGQEVCDQLLGCIPGPPRDCSDGIACTVDSCNEDLEACVNVASNGLCDNGLFCDGGDLRPDQRLPGRPAGRL